MLELTLAAGPYDRTEALRDGRVQPEGIHLTYLTLSPEETFWRQLQYGEFDISEMSFSKYIFLRSQGDDRFVALPVFPSRSFRHRNLFINTARGISRPEDLKGKRVGLPEYSMTAAVWVRGFLQDEHGVRAQDITWVQGGQENPGRVEKVGKPAGLVRLGIQVESEQEKSLSQLLAVGELDAIITAKEPSCYGTSPNVRRLYEDYRAAEEDYFRRTRVFPIMHCVVIRRPVYEANPWVAQSMMKAFRQAKAAAVTRLEEIGALSVMLPWLPAEIDHLKELCGPDWWPYGVEENRDTIERLMRYQTEQGMLDHPVPLDVLFAPSTFTTFKV